MKYLRFYVASMLSLILWTIVQGQGAGILDTSFGNKGVALTGFLNYNATSSAIAIQQDDKIVQAGQFLVGSFYNVGFARFTKDGALDVTFGTGGQVAIPFSNDKVLITALHVLSDGKILAAGQSDAKPLLIRLNANGTPDNGFGTKGVLSFSPELTGIIDLKISASKKMIGMVNNSTGQYCVFRLNEDGTYDSSFGNKGISCFRLGDQMTLKSLVIHSDGRILITGTAYYSDTKYDLVLIRLLSNGTVDPSFGSGGVARAEAGTTQSYELGWDLAIQKDGKIVSCGYSYNGTVYQFLLTRFLTDGEMDAGFGSNGSMTINYFNSKAEAKRMRIQDDGKILLAGYAIDGIAKVVALARIQTNGTLDSLFGNFGKVISRIEQTAVAEDVHVQSDQKIVIGGYAQSAGQYKYFLTRYLSKAYVSVDDIAANGSYLEVWPNPIMGSKKLFTWNRAPNPEDLCVRLISGNGQIVWAGMLHYENGTDRLQCISLPEGYVPALCFLQWRSSSASGAIKLIGE